MIVPIKNYPGYTISDTGVVYNKNGLALLYQYRRGYKKSGHPYKPYPRVCLYKNSKYKWFSVHRLVALHFLPNPENLPVIHHKDNDPENPVASNLQWVTYSENTRKAFRDGCISTENKKKGARKYGNHPGAVKVKITHKQTGKELKFDSVRRLQEFFKQNNTAGIQQALREPHRTVKGYYITRD